MAGPQMLQFYVAAGQAWESGPSVGVLHHSGGGFWLYTHAEASPPPGEEACRRAIACVESVLRDWSLSYTSGLQAALLRAHQEQRERPGSSGRGGMGVTCALLRGGQVYLAQAGPTTAYISSAGGLSVVTPSSTHPMGGEAEPEVQLHRHHVAAGDVILMASSSLSRLVTPAGIEALLASSMDEAARDLFRLARQEASFSALLLRPSYLE
ncbi:MAG: hypothetical protein HYY01_13935 [Chloroflexi bacterium]|nr:hypothetical protein [Chloroflexota bacterium]